MTSVKLFLDDVPQFLRTSQFYLSLNTDESDSILVPSNCFKKDEVCTDKADLFSYLHTLRFWGTDIDVGVLPLILNLNDAELNELLAEMRGFQVLNSIADCVNKSKSDRVNGPIETDNVEVLKMMIKAGYGIDPSSLQVAMQYDSVACFTYLKEYFTLALHSQRVLRLLLIGIEYGSIACLECLGPKFYPSLLSAQQECVAAASKQDKVESLRYLQTQNILIQSSNIHM